MDFEIEELEDKLIIKMSTACIEIARASCFIKDTPKQKDEEVATIGEIEAENVEDGVELLNKCIEELKERGFKYVVGPMNKNTWNEYRAIENVSEKEIGESFKKAGFKEIHTYTSNKGKIKDAFSDDVLEDMSKALEKDGFKIRNFDKNNAKDDLKKMYRVAKESFKNNPFYTDIKEQEFIDKYEKYISLCDDRLILIAEKGKEPVGFLFSMPNFNKEKPDAKVSTLILKTIAVKSKYEDYALGNVLLNMIRKTSTDLGYKDWIFAFMYKNNTSQRMAQRNKAKEIREYSLFGKELK